MLVSLLSTSLPPHREFPFPLSSSPSRVFISPLLQSAPTAAIFILLFLSFHLSRCQSECLHYKKNWASLAVPSESNDLRKRSSNRSTGEKNAGAIRRLTLSFLRKRGCVLRNDTILKFVEFFLF